MKRITFFVFILFAFPSLAQPVWQQRVDTKIEVRLDDKHHMLHAYEEFVYTNNSPDTLHYIYVHLWPNAYKNDHTPYARQADLNRSVAFYYSKPKDRGYIDSLQFTIDGHAADYYSSDNAPDIARIDLQKPLLPGEKMKVTTPFRVKIPKVFSRMGHTGQAYYISQWFPKPAVYDQKGWHPISYLDQGEFFSEFGSYDVSITLPANYVVMATGNCTDQKENDWLDELSKKALPTEKYKKRSAHNDTIPPSAAEMKTLHFYEENIHDFAWFADKRWLVRKDTVYSPGNNQLVTTWAAFVPSYWEQWQKATGYLKETVKHYGTWVGPYPYKTIKAVEGDLRAGGGMEYPTVTVIDRFSSPDLKTVVIHEAGHNWFYGMLGSNERDHAWMDEGINTFYEEKTSADMAAKDTGKKKKKSALNEQLAYYHRAAIHEDQAIEQTSANFEKLNYGLDVYYKTAMSLRWLEKYIGEENFERGMHDYYEHWHFHHPYPGDLQACLQQHTAKPINWFFDTILTNSKRVDFTITHAKTEGDHTEVTVRNNTHVYSPVLVDARQKDSTVSTAWSQPFDHTATLTVPTATWRTMKIDDVVPDGKSTNNVYRRGALFHHFGVKVKPFLGLNVGDKDKVFVSPAVGYNQYDGIMAGLLIHDMTIPENRFRYALAPMYSFETNSPVGAGSVGYLWYPTSAFKEIMLQADAKTFHYNETFAPNGDHFVAGYTKAAPSLNFTFGEQDPLSSVERRLTLKGYSIDEDNFNLPQAPAVGISSEHAIGHMHNNYGLLRYRHTNSRTYNPFGYNLEGQVGSAFSKVSAEGNIYINYNKPGKGLIVRCFLGKFFPLTNDPAVYSRYELNAAYTGIDDYLYDGTYIGRNAPDKIAAQQISVQEGGFKIPTFNNVDRSDNWMAAINLKSSLPVKFVPIRLFFDAGLIPNPNPSVSNTHNTTVMYDGGIEIYLVQSLVSVYVPVIMSSDFQNYLTNTYGRNNVFAKSVSFTLHLQNINWLRAPERVFKMVAN